MQQSHNRLKKCATTWNLPFRYSYGIKITIGNLATLIMTKGAKEHLMKSLR